MSDKLTIALEGNFGEHFVSSQLAAAGCLVRPVANQADTGVDLYCETSVAKSSRSNTPFLHFWVQVKTGTKFEYATSEQLYCLRPEVDLSSEPPVVLKIKARELLYWERQPIPVFIFCVAINAWPPTGQPGMQVLPLTDLLLGEHQPLSWDANLNLANPHATPNASLKVPCALELTPFDQIAMREFLDVVVPRHSAALQVRRGVVANLPSLSPSYVRKSARVPSHRFVSEIVSQLRCTSAQAIISAFVSGQLSTLMGNPSGDLLRAVTEVFANAPAFQHWDDWLALGLLESHANNLSKAAASFGRAAQVIRDDLNNLRAHSSDWVHEEKDWQRRLSWLDEIAKTGRVGHWFFTPLSSLGEK